MSEHPHQEHASALEREADDLERHSKALESDIADVREDWDAKRRDDSVPGAPPPPPKQDASQVDPEDEFPSGSG